MYAKYIKRLIDFILSLITLIMLSPIFLILAILIRVNLGSPVIFKQERVGKDERIFTMYKFRTMSDKKDTTGNLLPDNERQTKLGNVLRSTSLDELPELINVLKGDIAIVGPRPLLVAYLPYYTQKERLRHSVRGGLTVPEVVYGNVTPTWEEQFSYEVEYVKNVSFLLDIKIIWNTFKIIIKRVESDYGTEIRNSLNVERKEMVENLAREGEENV